MTQRCDVTLFKTSAYQDARVYLTDIFDLSFELILCLLDLIFYVFLNVVDLISK